MKVYKYKTLEGLINQTEKKRINLEEILTSSAILKGRGYCKFELSAEGREKFARMAAKLLGGRKYTQDDITRIITFSSVYNKFNDCYSRLMVEKGYRTKELEATYCAGQDYVIEKAYVRKELLNH